jgi:hypothetical protein
MEYRGKTYSIVQGLGADSWTWTVDLDDNAGESGEAKSRAAALTAVVMLIDKTLAVRRGGRVPPSGERSI